MKKEQLSQRFHNFGSIETVGSSELYSLLALKIAQDDEILELCTYAKNGQPLPNLLFGAVHYLLLKGKEHELKEYYPSITRNPREKDGVFLPFKEFCKIYREEIIALLQSKLVQTNEVRRCAYLYPIFCYIYEKVKQPLSLIEIGTSAGLQLNWDKYRYSYGTGEEYGKIDSKVHITSEIRGGNKPSFPVQMPPVASKIGLDLHTNDLCNKEDRLWLRALIWPEHHERVELFDQSAEYFTQHPVELVEGDGVALLEEVVANLPTNSAICIFHTHVANQFPLELKHELVGKIKKIGSTRNVFHVYNNMWDGRLHVDSYISGIETQQTVGDTDGHGRWFEWNLE
ncbi:DUF2332 domain-containing protein [Bacillus timonensis]|nr:DUF2332 domain-containing protein [Bacillus timonensis]